MRLSTLTSNYNKRFSLYLNLIQICHWWYLHFCTYPFYVTLFVTSLSSPLPLFLSISLSPPLSLPPSLSLYIPLSPSLPLNLALSLLSRSLFQMKNLWFSLLVSSMQSYYSLSVRKKTLEFFSVSFATFNSSRLVDVRVTKVWASDGLKKRRLTGQRESKCRQFCQDRRTDVELDQNFSSFVIREKEKEIAGWVQHKRPQIAISLLHLRVLSVGEKVCMCECMRV